MLKINHLLTTIMLSVSITGILFFQSCSKPNNTDNTEALEQINWTDFDGIWLLKGNSNNMILLKIGAKYNCTYSFYNGNFKMSYEIVQYNLNDNKYSFMGKWSGGCSFDDVSNVLHFANASSYYPNVHLSDGISGNDITIQPMLNGDVNVEKKSNEKMTFSMGELFFEGQQNTDYSTGFVSNNVEQEYVDLGLSIKWAKCNIGAKKAEEYGYYVGWGDPTGNNVSTDLDDYPCSTAFLPENICGTSYDIAHVKWGNGWRLPTIMELKELFGGCVCYDDTDNNFNGVNGIVLVGITGKSIFLPNAGHMIGQELKHVGTDNFYWSGELFNDYKNAAWGYFSGCMGGWYEERNTRCSVRAVKQ